LDIYWEIEGQQLPIGFPLLPPSAVWCWLIFSLVKRCKILPVEALGFCSSYNGRPESQLSVIVFFKRLGSPSSFADSNTEIFPIFCLPLRLSLPSWHRLNVHVFGQNRCHRFSIHVWLHNPEISWQSLLTISVIFPTCRETPDVIWLDLLFMFLKWLPP
jgi:hypothetical protein